MPLAPAENELDVLQRLDAGAEQRFELDSLIRPDLLKLVDGDDHLLFPVFQIVHDGLQGIAFFQVVLESEGQLGNAADRVR